jgi:hypothetical protein
MTRLYRLDRVRVQKRIESAVGSCEVFAESEDDARSQAAAEYGQEWLDPNQVTCRESAPLDGYDIPPGKRGFNHSF